MDTIDTRLDRAAEEAAAVRNGPPTEPVASVRRSLNRRTRLLTAASVIVVFGIVGSFALVAGQDESTPIVLAMNSSGEVAIAVGTFPHLVVDQAGWSVSGVQETPQSASYRYERGDEKLAIRIEFGDEDALNRLLSDRTVGAAVVSVTEVDEQLVALVQRDGGGTWIAIWGAAGRVYELVAVPMTSEDEVLRILGDLTIADEARWAEAVSDLPES